MHHGRVGTRILPIQKGSSKISTARRNDLQHCAFTYAARSQRWRCRGRLLAIYLSSLLCRRICNEASRGSVHPPDNHLILTLCTFVLLGCSIVFQVCNVLIIQSVPAEYSGIGSSVFQMCAQTGEYPCSSSPRAIPSSSSPSGVVIGSSVQAALYTAVDNNLADWRGHQYGFYFVIGCLVIALVMVGMILPVGDCEEREEREEAEGKSTEMG